MKAERSAVLDRPLTTLPQRVHTLAASIRNQRPAATYRDGAHGPLETIEAVASRTVAEVWGCWS